MKPKYINAPLDSEQMQRFYGVLENVSTGRSKRGNLSEYSLN